MENLTDLQQLVKEELTDNMNARKSDIELILGVMRRRGIDTDAPFSFILRSKERPNLESITRLRRKVQEANPELKDEEIAGFRDGLEKEYREYMRAEA